MPTTTDLYTMVFKKNGNEVTEANGGDIIDVELYSTNPLYTRPEDKEISNFQWDILNPSSDDLDFSNCNYVNDTITNSLGIVPLTAIYKDSGFLKKFIGATRGLTAIIKFKIKLAEAKLFTQKKATVIAKGAGFIFSNGDLNREKSFNLTIKPKINKWAAGGAAVLAIATAASNQENNN